MKTNEKISKSTGSFIKEEKGFLPIILGIIAGILAAGMIFIVLVVMGVALEKKAEGLPNDTGTPVATSNACISPIYPNITNENVFAKAINSYINQNAPKAPLNSLGSYFVGGGKKSGVNPAYVVAIAQHESTFGQFGIANNGGHNSFGRKAGPKQPSVNGFYAWPTWEDSLSTTKSGYDDISAYIKKAYIDGGLGLGKLDTIEKISVVYCPPTGPDKCANTQYIADIKSSMNKIIDIAKKENGVQCE